jgi:flagellar basal-body rod modification protein FlgD
MQVTSATTADRAAAATDANGTPLVSKKKNLDQNDFLKLLAVQFQSQDPMKPMDDTAFIAQMAQFTTLEQGKSLTAEMVKLRTDQQLATANSYLGKQVTVNDGSGSTATGLVSGIQVGSDGPRIVVGDYTYPISSVLLVEPAPATTTPAPAGGS